MEGYTTKTHERKKKDGTTYTVTRWYLNGKLTKKPDQTKPKAVKPPKAAKPKVAKPKAVKPPKAAKPKVAKPKAVKPPKAKEPPKTNPHQEVGGIPYVVRRSSRAQRTSFVAKNLDGKQFLEVTAPMEREDAAIRADLESVLPRLKNFLARTSEAESGPPSTLTLAAVGKVFKVVWDREGVSKKGTSIKEIVGKPPTGGTSVLKIQGPAPIGALQKWMTVYSKAVFDPWLKQVADRTGHHNWKKLITRFKKTSWGSCSTSGTISLNAALLFLPPKVVESTMIHELCHTVHHNHSKAFWAEVHKADPNYLENQKIKRAFEKSTKGSWFGGVVASPDD